RDFAVDLEPFTVLIGPNSAGKSNVLDALGLLSRLASQPIAEAFKQGRGKSIDQFSRHGGEIADRIRFAAEFLEHGDYPAPKSQDNELQSRFRYELTIERQTLRSGVEKLVALDEHFRAMGHNEDTWIQAHPELVPYAHYSEAGVDYITELKSRFAAAQQAIGHPVGLPEEINVPPTHTVLASTRGIAFTNLVRENLQGCRMFDPKVGPLGEPSDRIDAGELSPNADNLPTVLAELPPNVIGEIRADLASLVPGIASFDVRPEGDEIRLDIELSGGEHLPARIVSAGTLRILALLTALRMKPRPFLLGIEEPENGIYPGRLRALLALLLEATTRNHEDAARELFEMARQRSAGVSGITINQLPTQIILTTHSPVGLAALRSRPQHLRFVDMVRRNGERVTRVRTVGKPGERDRLTISPREIDRLLQATESEQPA
ncbi:MAG: ATP-binding protein, partial [Polyangiaceae bacterium]|nr:ATP-binding protein [Polyangiaceae bacterium]